MNQALFLAGGHCGYVLQPSIMRDEAFDPFDKSSLRGLEPCAICIEVGRGRSAGLLPASRPGCWLTPWGRGHWTVLEFEEDVTVF